MAFSTVRAATKCFRSFYFFFRFYRGKKKASSSFHERPRPPRPLTLPPPPRPPSRGGHQLHHTHPACSSSAAALFLEVVALGGAFFRNGNVTPAAEANILAAPSAADLVLSTSGLSVRMVGLDVTHSCRMTAGELESLRGTRIGFLDF